MCRVQTANLLGSTFKSEIGKNDMTFTLEFRRGFVAYDRKRGSRVLTEIVWMIAIIAYNKRANEEWFNTERSKK